MASATTYHLITRHPKEDPPFVTYQRLPEPVAPFGLNRSPSFQFMQRLRNFPPNLDDVIVIASTTSGDIGLVTRSKIPLSDDASAEKISNVFTTTTMAEDSRRAQMPLSEELTDTSPIGLGFDLSSKDKVEQPLPKEEYDASRGPLPALMVLNNEGVLSIWWFVYAESIRQGTTFPGLVVAGESQAQQQPTIAPQAVTPFGQSTFGSQPTLSTNTLGKSPVFGSMTTPEPAFGAPSALGKASTPFGGASMTGTPQQKQGPVFGQSGFGTSGAGPAGISTQGSAFGVAGGMGSRSSPWGAPPAGTARTAAANGSLFGQSGFSAAKTSPFGASSTSGMSAPTTGAFASFASKSSPFMTATPGSGADSPFSKPGIFGSGMNTDTSFKPQAKNNVSANETPFASGGFTLGSTFKQNAPDVNKESRPDENAGGSMFGGGFGDALGAAQKEPVASSTKDTDMDGEDDASPDDTNLLSDQNMSTTPAATPAAPKSSFSQISVPPKTGGLFGTQAQSKDTPVAVGNSQPTGFTFGKPTFSTATPSETPPKPDQPKPSVESSPKIKEEPNPDENADFSASDEQAPAPPLEHSTPEAPRVSKTSEAPLPPESTSKASFAPGDSSNSSKSSDDAPLPPDFLPSKTKLTHVEAAPHEDLALPSGDENDESEGLSDHGSFEDEDEGTDSGSGNLDEEGSGVDVAQEMSPTTDTNQSPKMTPGSSFGGPQEKSPQGGLFGRVTAPADQQKGKPPLFGEVGKSSPPYLPPPSKTQESPRSPSPVRSTNLGDSLRPDNARSISAPGPFQALNNRKAVLSRTAVSAKPQPSPEDIRKQVQEQVTAEQDKRRKEEEQNLSDQEDERVREELEAEVEGTLKLDTFLAHQDYVGGSSKPGIPGQIEKVYRDINSMIDTLGINARSLKAFTKGHEEQHKADGARNRDDLERNDWCLIEIGDLPRIEDDLSIKLENSCIADSQDKSAECRSLRKELKGLRNRRADIIRAVDTHSDPDEVESARIAPLSLDQVTQQHDIRKKMARFQKSLAEAEENITMLRTKLASCDTSSRKGPPMKKPTVEAVTNTISKMTNIVEKKNRDLELLENQMRQLRFSSVPSFGSREGSPFEFASPRRKPGSRFGASVNGHYQTPSRSSMLGRSVHSEGTARKNIAEATPEDALRYQEKMRRRKEVNEIMRREFEKETRIRTLE